MKHQPKRDKVIRWQFIAALALVPSLLLYCGLKATTADAEGNGKCEVQARSSDEIGSLLALSSNASAPRDSGTYHESLPNGIAVDPETEQAISNVIDEVVDCVNAGDQLRLAALYTEHAIYARGPLSSESIAEQTQASPQAMEPGNAMSIEQIHTIEFVPGAFVCAVVTFAGIEDTDPLPGVTFAIIFAMTSEGWRIEDQYDRIAPEGASSVTFVAELVGD